MELNVNTEQMKEYGQEIIKLTKNIDDEIIAIFAKINHLVNDGIWQGVSAQKFYQRTVPNKEILLNFNKELKKYGTHLINYSDKLTSVAKEYR